jgi:L,D-transpeptidase ErfK/SrfK
MLAIGLGMKVNIITKLAAMVAVASVDGYAEEKRGVVSIVVSIPDRTMVVLQGDRVLKIYHVAVGKPSTPSPQGQFRIVNRIPHPTYYGPGTVIGPGAQNPLGTRWMGLSAKGYGIHGTNAPGSIGKAVSHGCIRMRQRDLEELFELVDIGATVELSGERPRILAMIFAIAVA